MRSNGINILAVDDDPAVLGLIDAALGREGIAVTCVANGRLGVEEFLSPSTRFQLVLIDYRMPEMDGLSVCRAIRERCAEDVPIIVMSSERLHAEAQQAGADAFLAKPFRRDELIDCVNDQLDIDA